MAVRINSLVRKQSNPTIFSDQKGTPPSSKHDLINGIWEIEFT
ncbi:uncharacterized protein G2W53_020235 [Senna tora]|uniref:Uncharacterized protein n=1 Tax=Senna tora TaxID=362788 RepID=A0A834WRB7_9FABA|nr:uncharacterized protein G2W53_020235 [Senna tora]